MRMFALLTSVTFLIAVMAAAAIEPGIGDATATLLFGATSTPMRVAPNDLIGSTDHSARRMAQTYLPCDATGSIEAKY
jgi:hypothetical protein